MKFRSNLHTSKKSRRYIFIVVVVLFILFSWYKLQNRSLWDGRRRFTIVVASQPVLVLSLEPQTQRAVVFTVPPNTQLEIPFGYGAYRVESVYHLGQLDPKRGGGKLLSKAIENTFGIWVDGFLAFGNNLSLPSDFYDKIPQIKKQYFSLFGVLGNPSNFFSLQGKLAGNLSFLDKVNVWLALRHLRLDKIKTIDFEKSGVLEENNLPDTTTVMTIDTQLAPIVLADNFEDRQVRAENISLEIVNAAGVDKLATQFALILTNLGASVMIKSTSEVESNFSCYLNLSKDALKNSMIVKRLITYYHCEIKDKLEEKGTVQLRIILGKEFYQ